MANLISVSFEKRVAMAAANIISSFSLTLCLGLALFSSPVLSQDSPKQDPSRDPFKGQTDNAESTWGNRETFGKRFSGQAGVIGENDSIVGRAGCPIVVVGNSVFYSRDLTKVSELDLESIGLRYVRNHLSDVSKDGRYFAVAGKSNNQKNTPVFIFDTRTGQKLVEIPGQADEILDNVLLSRNKYLLTAGRLRPIVRVWNIETGELVKEYLLHEKRTRLQKGGLAISDNGHYLAAVENDQIVVRQVANNKVVATMEPPTKSKQVRLLGGNKRNAPKNDHVFIYASLQRMAFSPDGQELACVSNHRGYRFLCWNAKTKLIVNLPFAVLGQSATSLPQLSWLPKQNGWLVNGNLIDRELLKPVVVFRSPFISKSHQFVHDQDTLIGRLNSAPEELQRFQIPWTQVNESKRAIKNEVEAYIAPYSPVGLVLDFDEFNLSSDWETAIRNSFENRLARDGIAIDASATSRFRLRLVDSSDSGSSVDQPKSIFDSSRPVNPAKKFKKGEIVVEFLKEPGGKPLWSAALVSNSGTSYENALRSGKVDEDVVRRLERHTSELIFPYFWPKNDRLLSLPLVID